MSVRELSVLADRKGHGKVYRAIRKARSEECGLIPMACLCDRARSQQSRFDKGRTDKKGTPPTL
jgi:DTW domain-containing protein YfiP